MEVPSQKEVCKTWVELKEIMRKKFVPAQYEEYLFHNMKSIKQGFRSVQAYYDELKVAMYHANVVDTSAARAYFKSGLNHDVAATVRLKYDGSMQDLVTYAIGEERRIQKERARPFNMSI